MNLAELLTGIETLVLAQDLPIWLATRTVKGQQIEGVQVRPVGGISVDEDSQELILMAANWVQADEIGNIVTVNDFCRWAAESQEQFSNFQLYGVQQQINLPDGGIARSQDRLIAWSLPDNPTALWLRVNASKTRDKKV